MEKKYAKYLQKNIFCEKKYVFERFINKNLVLRETKNKSMVKTGRKNYDRKSNKS
jgi:hypothetical protein